MSKIDQFEALQATCLAIYKQKNHDYGDSFGKSYSKWGLPMACIRLSDKLNRLEQFAQGTDLQVKDESVVDTLLDLANYAIMTAVEYHNTQIVKPQVGGKYCYIETEGKDGSKDR